jgi:predicted FMN-binding regulatory protein PaiB
VLEQKTVTPDFFIKRSTSRSVPTCNSPKTHHYGKCQRRQKSVVLSADPEANFLPSGLKATENT